jgi:hypothetical protein
MKLTAVLAGLTLAVAAAPALAQDAAPAAEASAETAAETAAKLSVENTPIGEIVKNEKAKAALEKQLPEITAYYDQIGSMTLAQVAPMSQGAIDEAKLKAIQADFDAIE